MIRGNRVGQHVLLQVGDIPVVVTYKRVRRLTLRIQTPSGDAHISAPLHTDVAVIRAFVESKRSWLVSHQERIRTRAAHLATDLSEEGSVRLWGERLPLVVVAHPRRRVAVSAEAVTLWLPAGHTAAERMASLTALQRRLVQEAAPPHIAQWSAVMQVTCTRLFVQKMKTRWGSCNYRTGHIRLNSDLALFPPECLEYVVVHELVHLLEASHNQRFYALMTQFYPQWKAVRQLLRGIPED